MRALEIITGHVIYNPAYGLYLQIPTENHQWKILKQTKCKWQH